MNGNVFVGRKPSVNSKLGYLGLKKATTSSMTRQMTVLDNHVALDRTLPNEGLRSKGLNNRRFSKEKQSAEENKIQLRSV